jgi:transcriptional/translational regulatory protein YebC/TACO1
MSGHSKWSTIKRKKGANDAQRAKEFTKVARMITVAAQDAGGDPAMNPTLALAIAKGKAINMPNDNIDRAIKRGTGEGGTGGRLEEVSYEGYGPNNVALIIDCTTDNRNRTVNDLRSIVEKLGGRFTESGAVSWQFKTVGRILIEFATEEEIKARENIKWNDKDKLELPKLDKRNLEEFELSLYDITGVEDVSSDEHGVAITTEYSALNIVRKAIEEKGILISDAELVKVSSSTVELPESEIERMEQFLEKIEEYDDVQKVWTNAENL